MQRDEVSDDAVVEAKGALILGQVFRIAAEPRDHVVAAVAAADLVGELSPAPVIERHFPFRMEKGVEFLEFFEDDGIFEGRVEDVHRLVLTRHWQALWTGKKAPPELA